MRITAPCHIEMVGELATLQAAVSSTTEFALGCLPNETFQVQVMDELIAKFWKQQERRSHLERPGVRVYDLIIGPPFGRA
jgi:hypothetical protein